MPLDVAEPLVPEVSPAAGLSHRVGAVDRVRRQLDTVPRPHEHRCDERDCEYRRGGPLGEDDGRRGANDGERRDRIERDPGAGDVDRREVVEG